MKNVILLNSDENTKKVEEEEKTRFVRNILESVGLPIEGIWDEDEYLSIENKMKLRSILSTFDIQVIDNYDGELQIFADHQLIAEWKKSEYVLKKDLSQPDPRKKLYLEMHINYWSVFENTE